ncbi:MAG: phosphopyruvate hydratase [Candidatus Moranbacteria bacterium]|nr:phosphopyruvate hydratase [Candidatus Moranbacteria bacterium]
MKIKNIQAWEILDSRGNPTIRVKLTIDSGEDFYANVPSGASTGVHEALELRDHDPNRFHGKGVLKAVENVNTLIKEKLLGKNVRLQTEIDKTMLELDGTDNKSKLGANAILGVSLAVARAGAFTEQMYLFEYIHYLSQLKPEISLPTIKCNVINGGAHANWGLDFQEYMLVPNGIDSTNRALRALSEIYTELKKRLKQANQAVSVGDEGGFAPRMNNNQEPLDYLIDSIEKAGYKPGKQVSLAMDVAASEFYNQDKQRYELKTEQKQLSGLELLDYYKELVNKYPIILIEDGMAQDDIENWIKLNSELGSKIAVMGDDFTVTNKKRLSWAIDKKALNSVLIKLNQIGTVTETFETMELAYERGLKTSVSHRSGETCDDFIADFAVGTGSDWIKSGSVARSERIAKYNRLIEIERNHF